MSEETVHIFLFQGEGRFRLTTQPQQLPGWLRDTGKWVDMPVRLLLAYEGAEAEVQAAAEEIENWLESKEET